MPTDVNLPYALEIRLQGAAAKVAFDRLEAELAARSRLGEEVRRIRDQGGPPPLQAEQEEYASLLRQMANKVPRILEALQSFLAAAGIISMTLWPDTRSRPGLSSEDLAARKSRGEQLRQLLELSDESPIHLLRRKATDPRGGLLHVDEMLDEVTMGSAPDTVVTFQVGRLSDRSGWAPESTVRWLDEQTLIVHVNERETGLRPILDEITRIARHIQVTGKEALLWGNRPREDGGLPFGVTLDLKK
ncbi:MAG: hypothetical protein L3J95_05065 [Thermoplasmata archaeon]|nr:hypothetical protein [Thermoplasmata archaeon]MCI4359771.1 hypothetical protein [Thermoplasmata archaeon]